MLFIRHHARVLLILPVLIVGLYSVPSWAISDVEIRKSPYDNRQYKGLYLDNGLKVLLVSDPSADKAAAALNVQAGSFNEPAEREGLAHFLEHMLFLGTKKYPRADEYSEYISSHGGSDNAWTMDRNTQYYFDVAPDSLEGALDRFAQFFIAPSFNADLVDRERHAVNSEYQLSIQSDGRRIMQADSVTANPAHPLVQFSMGSLATLGDNPKLPPVRQALIEFYNNYYSPERMTLAVVAPQPLPELEKMVAKYFSMIPKHAVKDNDVQTLPYTKNETGKQLSIQTLGDYQEISMSFPIPSQRNNYQTKSIEYILYMLQQSGPKGLYQVLKSKNWIIDMSVYKRDLANNQDIAKLSFSLTALGMQHIDEIVGYTFEYIEFLRQVGPQAEIFNDLKAAGERNFTYGEKQRPADYASDLPDAIQHYPLADVLTADSFSRDTKYTPGAINQLLTYFSPRNMRLMIASKNIRGDNFEPSYKVNYAIQDLSAERMAKWSDLKPSGIFALPPANMFMPTNFALLTKADAKPEAVPVILENNAGLTLWYKQDQTFGLPKQNLIFLLKAPDLNNSAKNAVMFKLLTSIVNDELSALASQFSLAGVGASIDQNVDGLIVSVPMFSDQQINVMAAILKIIADTQIDPIKFNDYKQDLSRDLSNFKQREPYAQAMYIMNVMMFKNSWLAPDLFKALKTVTPEDFVSYYRNFLNSLQVEALVHGNISRDAAIALVSSIGKSLKINPNLKARSSASKMIQLKNGSSVNYAFNPGHKDSTLIRYYQAQSTDDKAIAVNSLLVEIMNVPLYDQLRTKEQLGYIVGTRVLRYKQQPGSQFFIESATKNAFYLDSRLRGFAISFKNKLKTLPLKQLETYKSSLQNKLLQKPNSLSEETSIYWAKIIDNSYRFNFNQEIASQLQTVLLKDVLDYYHNLWLNPKTRRLLTVNSYNKGSALVNSRLINNIEKFKKNSIYN